MKRTRTSAVLWACLSLHAACGSSGGGSSLPSDAATWRSGANDKPDDSGTSSDASSDSTTGSGLIRLTATGARFEAKLDGALPPDGRAFLLVDARLENLAAAEALPLLSTLFSLETTGAVSVQASTRTASAPNGCSPDLSISKGGAISCALVFEAPTGQLPKVLLYEFGANRAMTDVPAPTEAMRGSLCEKGKVLMSQDTVCSTCDNTSCQVLSGIFSSPDCAAAANCLRDQPTGTCDVETCLAGNACRAQLEEGATCLDERCASECP